MQIAKKENTSKHTQKGKKSFFQVDVIWWALHVQNALSIVGRVTQGFFLNSLKPVMPFINITETITLRSSSSEPLSKFTCIRLS